MNKINGCHQCPYNGKGSKECLKCHILDEQYSYPYHKYIFDEYDPPEMQKDENETKVTNLSEDVEDAMRQLLYSIFDLDFSELLLLKSIMNGRSLTEFAQDFNDFIQYQNSKKCKMTRFLAFQTRKRISRKIDKIALVTKGQKRGLKSV